MQSLPSYVVSTLSRLEETGAEAYVVGGAVRDALRDAPVHDYDITTSATPEEVLIAFAGERTVETGLKHGTVTVLLEGVPLEITTFRIDGGYHDGRHPDSVTFTRSLREDSARRDFTVNAMASDKAGRIYDFFGGKEDLKAGVIRTVGDPLLRFKEDALRILRALRFASTLDFRIEERTLCAARLLKEDLKRISPERIREELIKLLTGKAAARVLREGREVLSSVLPEILPTFGFDQRNPHHAFDLWEHTVRTVDAVLPVPHLRLAALLHDLGKPSCFKEDENGVGHFYGHAEKSERIAEGILSRLRFDNKTRHTVLLLVKQHDVLPQPATRQFARMRSRYSDEFLFDWLALIRADRTAQMPVLSPEKDAVLREAEDAAAALLQKEERLDLHSLAIGGEDLFRCGVPRGKEMGILLQRALAAVLDGAVKNEKEALLSYLSLTPIECERKLLIRFPSLSVLCELGAEESEIEQTYLLSEEGVTERVRRRVYKDGTLYFYTKKIRINALSAKEYERELSKAEYDGLLSRRDRTRTPILKRRFVLPYEGHLLEIDVYPFWTRQAILEVELSSETEGFSLPPFIEVLRDVTADKAYKNQMLARRIPPEEGEK